MRKFSFAGNSYVDLEPSMGSRWNIIAFGCDLVCDATVANRYIKLDLKDADDANSNICGLAQSHTAITASQSKGLALVPLGFTSLGAGCDPVAEAAATLMFPIALVDHMAIRVSVIGGVAGDVASGNIVFLESGSG